VRALLLLALVTLGCGALAGAEPVDRAERARMASAAVRQGVGITRDACLTYITYRAFLPETVPETDELCSALVQAAPIAVEPVTLPAPRAPEPADAGAPEAGP
jgi:hypothetical protein